MADMKRIHSWARWLPATVWMAVIFASSSIPGAGLPGRFSVLWHTGSYAVLGAAVWWAASNARSPWKAVAFAVVFASLYGLSDEFHQHFVPGRTPDPVDWAVDTVSAAVATVALAAARTARASRVRIHE